MKFQGFECLGQLGIWTCLSEELWIPCPSPPGIHWPLFIIPSHYIGVNTVNVCKSQGCIFTRVVPRGYICWKRIQFTNSGIIKNGILWKSFGGSMVNVVPREVPRPKILGACSASAFWPCNSLGTIFTTLPPWLFQECVNKSNKRKLGFWK